VALAAAVGCSSGSGSSSEAPQHPTSTAAIAIDSIPEPTTASQPTVPVLIDTIKFPGGESIRVYCQGDNPLNDGVSGSGDKYWLNRQGKVIKVEPDGCEPKPWPSPAG